MFPYAVGEPLPERLEHVGLVLIGGDPPVARGKDRVGDLVGVALAAFGNEGLPRGGFVLGAMWMPFPDRKKLREFVFSGAADSERDGVSKRHLQLSLPCGASGTVLRTSLFLTSTVVSG
jgi:hypothetical protein